MRIDIVTIFPKMFEGPLSESLLGKARQAKVLDIRIHNLRQWSDDRRHQKVDDRPYGGGAGMVFTPEPLYQAIKSLGGIRKKSASGRASADKPWVVYLSPQGKVFSQKTAEGLVKKKRIILLCGHYEGIDERVMSFVDQEISIGDYVLTGGEIPAMVVVDALARFVPGVVGDPESVMQESFSNGLLDHPHYTRPAEWRGRKVPPELVSGDHAKIKKWRTNMAMRQTKKKRPEILKVKI